jgi:hypothetical protein
MAKKSALSDYEMITEYINSLKPDYKIIAEALRTLILKTDQQIGEQIKWNVPCFYYNGNMKPFNAKEYKRDIIVTNFRQKDHVLLVLPSGANVNDDSGLLEGDYDDGRRLMKIYDLVDLQKKEKALQSIIKKWLLLIDK